MAPALELLRATKTDLFKTKGVESVQGVLDILNVTEGHIASYFGTEVQDPNTWYAIILWETVAHHQALIDNKTVYPDLIKSITQGAEKIEFVQHTVLSTAAPEKALEAPVTEVVLWTVKEGADKEEVKRLVGELVERVLATDAVKGRGGFGSIVEDENKVAVILGWDGYEEFVQAVASTPWVGELVGKIKTLADLDLKHVVLTKDTSKV
ncbi:hypothetical protein BDY19DRAFT_992700 [Irpex rosettiformis]|uniref:Uncharacterized protein n=1 Tax=Irpex rosettiformis TaxID=378272 RepID=A0ACB8U5W3_9APHY|nr:hypothetical protein BDY19DRAFT_992700 [Irpex rosettiformis]